VPDPGPDWPTVVSALIDGMGLVVVNAAAEDRAVRSLQARARECGCVLYRTTMLVDSIGTMGSMSTKPVRVRLSLVSQRT
jgi:hypothetical protein